MPLSDTTLSLQVAAALHLDENVKPATNGERARERLLELSVKDLDLNFSYPDPDAELEDVRFATLDFNGYHAKDPESGRSFNLAVTVGFTWADIRQIRNFLSTLLAIHEDEMQAFVEDQRWQSSATEGTPNV